MTLKFMCPEKEFGEGCDFARLSGDDYAELFEIKRSSLTQSDATKAVTELKETRDHLKAKSLVRASCAFTMWLIHEKRRSCKTYGIAAIILEKEKIGYAHSDDAGFDQTYREWVRFCK
jgi:hypothetical protein